MNPLKSNSSSRGGGRRLRSGHSSHSNHRSNQRSSNRRPAPNNGQKKQGETEQKKNIPPIAPGVVRIIPLGGVEEIGKNMTAIEFGNDIIVVDAGLAFPDDDTPGVDYIIPDTTYLEERKSKIRGLVVTHAHLDHIGGIPYIMGRIGNPTIYTSLLTAVMIKKRQDEFPHLPKLDIQLIETKDKIKLGNMTVRFFAVTHTIPDSVGIIIETPFGNIIVTGDIKLDHEKGIPVKEEVAVYEKIGKEKNLIMLADSTNAEKPGFSMPESEVAKNIREFIKEAKGRIIIGAFASQFERIVRIIENAEALGKKIAIEGRSMKTNIEIAKELGLLKVKRDTIISSDNMDSYPDNQIVVLATGAQGDEFAALMRIAQKEHRTVKIRRGDTVMLSSSVIPGNETSVQRLKDNLSRQGARIIHYGVANIHSSGHSYQAEIEWVHKMIKPKFFIPVHGHHFMLRVHAEVAEKLGMSAKNILVPDNGSIIEITDEGTKIGVLKEKTSSRLVMVDGIGANDVKEIVIRDRQMLAQDGIFIIVAIVDIATGKVRKSPDIITRGFVYIKESQELLRHVRLITKKTIEEATKKMHPINLDYVKNMVREEIGKYLFQKTHNRPMVLTVLIEV